MPDTAPTSDDGTNALHEALATADVLRRVAGTVAIHLYESEYLKDGTYVCNTFIGEGLKSLLGPLPEDKTPEEAWEEAVHPDDQETYDVLTKLEAGEAVEIEYRLVGYDGKTRWVWDRMRPRRGPGGQLLVDGIVADITERRKASDALKEARRQLQHIAFHDPLTGLQQGLLPGAARRGARPLRRKEVRGRRPLHRPGQLQADQRQLRPRGRRRAPPRRRGTPSARDTNG